MDKCCPICFENLDDMPSSKLITCAHEFHIECIHHWLKIRPNCPMCRMPLENDFKASQIFSKNHKLNCELSLQADQNLKINYNNSYKVFIPYYKIKSVFVDDKCTNIEYNHFDKIIILKFKIPDAFYFLECFRNKVTR